MNLTWRRAAVRSTVAGVAVAAAAGTLASAVAAFFAHRLVSPAGPQRPDDVEILAVGADTLTLRAEAETCAPGQYGLWLDGGAGHARVGQVLDRDDRAGTVTRALLGVDHGTLQVGSARWNQYYFCGTPTSALGLAFENVEVTSDVGVLPAWFVAPSAAVTARDTWAVLVHGRGATRQECLRVIPVLHRLGFPSLTITYRNDAGAAPSKGHRYHLGESEWLDLEAAILYAVERGARDVVLVGWSMGGAISLQLTTRSWTADRVRALVLDAPVVDWRDVLEHQARINRVPAAVGRLSQSVLQHTHASRLLALDAPICLDRMDWVTRAGELTRPILLLHSDDDEFVPSGPSRRLAHARPDLVTLVSSSGARHTKEWNVDPEAWESAVARYLLAL